MADFRPRFFVDVPVMAQADLRGLEFCLSESDAHHALHVLRLKPGELCEVVVGSRVFFGEFCPETRRPRVRILEELVGSEAGARYRVQVGLVQAITKPALLDYVVEKGTEVGASFFVLVASGASPKNAVLRAVERLPRWQRIAYEAAKQSKQVAVPRVELATGLLEAHASLDKGKVQSLVLDPRSGCSIRDKLAGISSLLPALALWVGPEAGWGQDEVDQLTRLGAQAVRLGRSVLRTETAGPVAVAMARLLLEDW